MDLIKNEQEATTPRMAKIRWTFPSQDESLIGQDVLVKSEHPFLQGGGGVDVLVRLNDGTCLFLLKQQLSD